MPQSSLFAPFEGVHITEEKEDPKKKIKARNLEEITASALSRLKTENEAAYEHLVAIIKDGSIGRHQTKGKIVRMVDELLAKLRGEHN